MAAATVSPTLVSAFPNGNVVTHPRVTEVKPPGSLNSNPLQLRQLEDAAGGVLGGTSGFSNGLPGGLLGGVPGGAPNGVPNGVSNDVPNGIPDGVLPGDAGSPIAGTGPNASGAGTSNTPEEPAQPANPYDGGRVNDKPSDTNGQTPNETGRRNGHTGSQAEIQNVVS
ncbi:uncharacterized protein LAESUDRAFT_758975 [Laetiporus sulphureus 93-53]|uniref:Uncharacterized protein n=1 Tax=Laetiporus sulphureus 93-53 TaxID=1314785 RepID=A0A165EDD9_9APHY|nr:uncharacterized protein LAESUDRAFT_758975 [Laetiporus sulphureus 93-53]KZT06793.1 hypothetical protein LAESUDRAFT_758975 [Laetiporus sulphureus 93-53]